MLLTYTHNLSDYKVQFAQEYFYFQSINQSSNQKFIDLLLNIIIFLEKLLSEIITNMWVHVKQLKIKIQCDQKVE